MFGERSFLLQGLFLVAHDIPKAGDKDLFAQCGEKFKALLFEALRGDTNDVVPQLFIAPRKQTGHRPEATQKHLGVHGFNNQKRIFYVDPLHLIKGDLPYRNGRGVVDERRAGDLDQTLIGKQLLDEISDAVHQNESTQSAKAAEQPKYDGRVKPHDVIMRQLTHIE